MAQNIYDDAEFFSAYSNLRRSVDGLAGAPEWPYLRAMLPDMDVLFLSPDAACDAGSRRSP